jgi:hypothetical protein
MEENQSLLDLQVDREAASNLTEATRWGKLLALITTIGFGLFLILIFFLWGKLSNVLFSNDELDNKNFQMLRIAFIVAFLIMGVILGIMMSFLVKGANRIRLGIQNRDQLLFNSGLNSIKNYFAMYGVLALLGLFFELLGLVTQ